MVPRSPRKRLRRGSDGPSAHAGAALEEQGLADGRLHRALLKRLGDQEGRLRPFSRQQPIGVGRDENDGNLEIAEDVGDRIRSEEHTSELQSLMRISYAVFCLKNKNHKNT